MSSLCEGHFRILEISKPSGINCFSWSLHISIIIKCTVTTNQFYSLFFVFVFVLNSILMNPNQIWRALAALSFTTLLLLFCRDSAKCCWCVHALWKIYKCYAMSGNTFMKIIHLWADCERFRHKRVETIRYVTHTAVDDHWWISSWSFQCEWHYTESMCMYCVWIW